MPETERDRLEWFREYAGAHAVIELVHAMPSMGVRSSFTFGRSCGGLRMAMIAAGIPFEEISPNRWQKAMGCIVKGRTDANVGITEKKNAHKAIAQELFPEVKVTHAIADALLIAEYCRRLEARA